MKSGQREDRVTEAHPGRAKIYLPKAGSDWSEDRTDQLGEGGPEFALTSTLILALNVSIIVYWFSPWILADFLTRLSRGTRTSSGLPLHFLFFILLLSCYPAQLAIS